MTTNIETGIPESTPSDVPITRYVASPTEVPVLMTDIASWDVTIATAPGRTVLVSPQLQIPDTDEAWAVKVNFKDLTPYVYAIPVNTVIHTRPIGELTGFQIGDNLNDGTIRFTIGDIRHKTGTDDEMRSWVGFTRSLNEIAFAAAVASTYRLEVTKTTTPEFKLRVVFTPQVGDPITAMVDGGRELTQLVNQLMTVSLPAAVYRWELQYSVGVNFTVWTTYDRGVIVSDTVKNLSLAKDVSILTKINDIIEGRLEDRADIAGYTIGGRTISTIPLTELHQLKLRYERRIRNASEKGRRNWYVQP